VGKGGRYVGLITLSPSGADCVEIWEPQPPGTLWTCPGLQCDALPQPTDTNSVKTILHDFILLINKVLHLLV
jgi:hypothetical protein